MDPDQLLKALNDISGNDHALNGLSQFMSAMTGDSLDTNLITNAINELSLSMGLNDTNSANNEDITIGQSGIALTSKVAITTQLYRKIIDLVMIPIDCDQSINAVFASLFTRIGEYLYTADVIRYCLHNYENDEFDLIKQQLLQGSIREDVRDELLQSINDKNNIRLWLGVNQEMDHPFYIYIFTSLKSFSILYNANAMSKNSVDKYRNPDINQDQLIKMHQIINVNSIREAITNFYIDMITYTLEQLDVLEVQPL